MGGYPTSREEWVAEATTCYLDGVRLLEKARDLDRYQRAMASLQAGQLAATLAGLAPAPDPTPDPAVGLTPAVPRVLPLARPQNPVSVNVGNTRVVVEQA